MIVETNKNSSTGKYEVDIKTTGVVAELEANKEVSIDVSNYSEPVEITPSSGKDGMEKATITLTNISSGSADLENNHEIEITENGTVEITPAMGKYGMKKVTATVNVSGGGGAATAYGWNVVSTETPNLYYLSVDIAPTNITKARNMKRFSVMSSEQIRISSFPPLDTYTRISDTEFEFYMEGGSVVTYTRNSSKDFTLWEAN